MYKYLLILTFLVISCDDAVKKVNSNEKKISSKVIMNNQTLENSKNNNHAILPKHMQGPPYKNINSGYLM